MKDHLRELVAQSKTTATAGLIVREYLQARVLEFLQRAGAFSHWAFLGGTALRFLFRLPRFSEDLVFSRTGAVVPPEQLTSEFAHFIDRVRSSFESETYQVDVRARPDAVVQSAFIGFPGLLHELQLSPHVDQKISIKVEIDTNPPPFAQTQTSIVRRHALLNLLHYNKSSLLAGKLHALINRPYPKGRDVYDLVWYLSDPLWPPPNLQLLQSSLGQTGAELSAAQVANWRPLIAARIAAMDWPRILADVRPFLENPDEIALLTRENVLGLLQHRSMKNPQNAPT